MFCICESLFSSWQLLPDWFRKHLSNSNLFPGLIVTHRPPAVFCLPVCSFNLWPQTAEAQMVEQVALLIAGSLSSVY